MSSLSLAWRAFCALFLHIHITRNWYFQYQDARPTVSISLTDLINRDLVACYHTSAWIFFICSVPLEMNFTLNSLAAQIAASSFVFSLTSLCMYFTASVVVRYLHSYYMSTDILDHVMTNSDMRSLIRILVISVSLTIQGLSLMWPRRVTLYLMLIKDYQSEESGLVMAVITILCSLALLANVVLRYFMYLERKRTDSRLCLRRQESDAKRHFLAIFLLSFLLLLSPSIFFLIYPLCDCWSSFSHATHMLYSLFCIIVPLAALFCYTRWRKHVARRVFKYLQCNQSCQ